MNTEVHTFDEWEKIIAEESISKPLTRKQYLALKRQKGKETKDPTLKLPGDVAQAVFTVKISSTTSEDTKEQIADLAEEYGGSMKNLKVTFYTQLQATAFTTACNKAYPGAI